MALYSTTWCLSDLYVSVNHVWAQQGTGSSASFNKSSMDPARDRRLSLSLSVPISVVFVFQKKYTNVPMTEASTWDNGPCSVFPDTNHPVNGTGHRAASQQSFTPSLLWPFTAEANYFSGTLGFGVNVIMWRLRCSVEFKKRANATPSDFNLTLICSLIVQSSLKPTTHVNIWFDFLSSEKIWSFGFSNNYVVEGPPSLDTKLNRMFR